MYAVCLQRPYKSHVVNMCVRGPLHLFSTFSHVSPVVIQVSLKDLLVDSSFKNLASEIKEGREFVLLTAVYLACRNGSGSEYAQYIFVE